MRSLLALVAASGCVTSTESSTSYNDSLANTSRSIPISGLTTEKAGWVYAQALTSTTLGARDPGATWQTIGAFRAGSIATSSGGEDYYGWTGALTNFTNTTWPAGGVARVRMLYRIGSDVTTGVTFDSTDCLFDNLDEDYESIALTCQSHDNGHLHLVDGTDVTRSSKLYISLRETPFKAASYYAVVDPYGDRLTLTDWKAKNGFSVTNTALPGYEAVVSATYFNKGDLELGRRMFCVRSIASRDVACFVTNYGDPAQPEPTPQQAEGPSLAAAVAQNAAAVVATVAMEYRVSDPLNRVTFFAYGPDGVRAPAALLDGEEEKELPGACLSCHGGRFNDQTHSVGGAHFLPFDVDNFSYSTTAGYTLADQQDAFRALNNLVLATGPAPAITDLVNGWYGQDLGTNGPDQDTSFVPTGWKDQEVMYREVVKPYCRSCHVAIDLNDFTSYDKLRFSAAQSRVCADKFDMPHAQVTRKNFWASPARGHLIGEFNWPTSCH